MNSRFIRSVVYRTYLDENVPITGYDLYENGNHRFAFLSFYNKTSDVITSFDVRVVLFNQEKEKIGEFLFHVENERFTPHTTFSLKKPLPLPLECEGFNYVIENIQGMNVHVSNQSWKSHIKLERETVEEKQVLHAKRIPFFRSWFIPLVSAVSLLVLMLPPILHSAKISVSSGSSESIPTEGDIQLGDFIYNTASKLIVDYVGESDQTVYINNEMEGYPILGVDTHAFMKKKIISVELYVSKSESAYEFTIYPEAFIDSPLEKFFIQSDAFVTVCKHSFENMSYLAYVTLNFQNGGFIEHEAFHQFSLYCDYNLYGYGSYYGDSFCNVNSFSNEGFVQADASYGVLLTQYPKGKEESDL